VLKGTQTTSMSKDSYTTIAFCFLE